MGLSARRSDIERDSMDPGAIPPRRSTILCLDPWPSPDLDGLGLTGNPRRVPGPRGQWYTTSPPGSSVWREAIDGIDHAVRPLASLNRTVEVFANTAPSIGAVLGLRLANLPARVRYWQANPHDWTRLGAALDHGQPVGARSAGLQALRDGRPIALLVELGAPILPAAIPLDLELEAQRVSLRVHDPERLFDPMTAQQVAFDLNRLLQSCAQQAPFSTVHFFYTGPLAILMMAASAFRAMRSVVSHERFGRAKRWRPAVHLQSGRAFAVPPG